MIPRIRIAHLPTPLEPLPRLSALLGGPMISVKRDDQTGLALGGERADAMAGETVDPHANGAQTLVTAGAVQSNHCRQVAALAAKFDLACVVVLSVPEGGQPPVGVNGNLLLDRLFGAQVNYCQRSQRDAALKAAFDQAWADGKRPYLIPVGGSTGVGAAGYVLALEELLAQDAGFDWIVLGSSSAGTQAGLVAGAVKNHWGVRILGISIDEAPAHLQARVAEIASECLDRLGVARQVAPGEVLVNGDYLGAGYGVVGEREREAIRLFARQEGLLLDPVYTGRAAGGMIDLIRKGVFKPNERVLFWHTGGTPALFGEPYAEIMAQM
jgi:1-aminocyclopropane-1-carboxylate deaminase/D-cysteine desulfhydrase-like pyridoxal-dependent ACC family enzyme